MKRALAIGDPGALLEDRPVVRARPGNRALAPVSPAAGEPTLDEDRAAPASSPWPWIAAAASVAAVAVGLGWVLFRPRHARTVYAQGRS
jgi:hypothetical protein